MPAPLRTLLARLTHTQRILAASMAIVLAGAGITGIIWASTDHPPSCARQQDSIGLTAQEQCLENVGNWCEANYPNDMACSNKVYGYDPRPLGSDN